VCLCWCFVLLVTLVLVVVVGLSMGGDRCCTVLCQIKGGSKETLKDFTGVFKTSPAIGSSPVERTSSWSKSSKESIVMIADPRNSDERRCPCPGGTAASSVSNQTAHDEGEGRGRTTKKPSLARPTGTYRYVPVHVLQIHRNGQPAQCGRPALGQRCTQTKTSCTNVGYP
jgi:hypothetical protein